MDRATPGAGAIGARPHHFRFGANPVKIIWSWSGRIDDFLAIGSSELYCIPEAANVIWFCPEVTITHGFSPFKSGINFIIFPPQPQALSLVLPLHHIEIAVFAAIAVIGLAYVATARVSTLHWH